MSHIAIDTSQVSIAVKVESLSNYLCTRCMEDLFEVVDPLDPDMLRCPRCGNIGSAQALEEKQQKALERFRNAQDPENPPDPQTAEEILRDVLFMLREDQRKNLGRGSSSRSKSSKEDKLRSTRLRKCVDDDSVTSATRGKKIDPLNVMLTIRKMGHVPSERLRRAILGYIQHLVDTGRLPPDFLTGA